jgi:hypothetical protein
MKLLPKQKTFGDEYLGKEYHMKQNYIIILNFTLHEHDDDDND